ncbi:MAG TPA: GNAT family N-acetyltransferase [Acetobacteraceae bacterium]|nr:GNAT family N-acetyltransferase [Acetobacteraceae bacterium]
MSQIIAISDDIAAHQAWLAAAEPLHRQLRPDIPAPYADYMRKMFTEGAEMAVVVEAERIRAIAIYRCLHTTYQGYRFYVDDLVTDESARSRGFGGQMIDWLEARARVRGCPALALDSGTQRLRAHKFYFAKGFFVVSFSFLKKLG